MNKLQNLIQKLKSDQRGLSTVEYVVLLVLIVAIAVALWNVFGNSLATKLTSATQAFDSNVRTNGDSKASKISVGGNAVGAETMYDVQK